MNNNEGQGTAFNDSERTGEHQSPSPSEKLEGDAVPTGSLTPGAENPESTEVKKEINPNSE